MCLRDLSLECHVNADFAGNYNAKEVNNPATMQSHTRFVITLGSVPVLWKSVVQTEIAISTLEAEYIALSTVMRKLIQLQTVLFEMKNTFGLKISNNLSMISTVFEGNWACYILATTDPPHMTPRLKSLAVKYHWFRSHLSEYWIVIKDIVIRRDLSHSSVALLLFTWSSLTTAVNQLTTTPVWLSFRHD